MLFCPFRYAYLNGLAPPFVPAFIYARLLSSSWIISLCPSLQDVWPLFHDTSWYITSYSLSSYNLVHVSAFLSSRSCTMVSCLFWQATRRGLPALSVHTFISAPLLSSSWTILSCPCLQAMWRGLVPSSLHRLISAPLFSRSYFYVRFDKIYEEE